MTRFRSTSRALQLALVLATTLVVVPHHAWAKVERSTRPSASPTDQVHITPPRIEADVVPGKSSTQHIAVTNDSTKAQDITITPSDFQSSSDPHQIGQAVESGNFGAGDWLTPDITKFRLAPFERIDFDVRIDTPVDAPTGTNLAALRVRSTAASAKGSHGPLVVDGLIEVFLTVAGPVRHDLRVTDVNTRDSFQFGSHRLVSWDVSFRNDGTVNEHVEGSLDVRSIFGTRADRIKIEPLLVLRGSTRTLRVLWRNVPWVGAFTPQVVVRGDDARKKTRSGSRTVVLPWWVFPLIALLVIGPAIWLWIGRRRAWREYMEQDDDDGDDDVLDDLWDPAHAGR